MAGVYKSLYRRANKPFYIDRVSLRIYSVEELCYIITENAELIEKDIFSRDLAIWLEGECGARELAAEIIKLITSDARLVQFVKVILECAPYISDEEKNEIYEIIRDMVSSDIYHRRKSHADFFLKKERYMPAIKEYEQLIETVDEEEKFFLAELYHSLGIAKARLFIFNEAVDAFNKAYELDEDPKHEYMAKAAMRLSLSEKEYLAKVSADEANTNIINLEDDLFKINNEFLESEEYKELVNAKENAQSVSDYEAFIDKKICDLKEEYRRFV